MQKKRAPRGFTLAELLIALLLSVIILTGAVGILAPLANTAKDLTEYAEMNRLLDTLSGGLIADLSQATEITTPAMGVTDASALVFENKNGEVSYTVDGEGLLCRAVPGATAAPVYEAEYYGGKTLELTCARGAGADASLVTVTLTVKSASDATLISRPYCVRPPVVAANP